jgi:hypothetical protein
MAKPKITRNRIILAFTVAVIADALEFPITGVEATVIGAPEGEAAAGVLDCIVMGIMIKLLGFHWMFLPSFIVEIIPAVDMFPTWVGCVGFVVWQCKREEAERAKAPPLNAVIDVQEVAPASPPPTARRILPPPLPAQIPPPLPIQSDIEKRLKKLDDLREHNMISQTEYDAKRQEILSKI